MSAEVDTADRRVHETMLCGAMMSLALPGIRRHEHDRLVYLALAASTALGYECGIIRYSSQVPEGRMVAIIVLPEGKVCFDLCTYAGTDDYANIHQFRERIRGYVTRVLKRTEV